MPSSLQEIGATSIVARECVAMKVAQSFHPEDIVRVLKSACRERGLPKAIRRDNGTSFVATPVEQWAHANQIQLDFSRPRVPTDSAFIEFVNGGVRCEFVNPAYFETLDEVRRAARIWRTEYNEFRPHPMLAKKTPREYARSVESNPTRRFPTDRTGP